MPDAPSPAPPLFLDAASLLEHWQGHRRLTRRVIEAFPDDKFFSFSLAGMRSFGAMAQELLQMGEPMARGAVTGSWQEMNWSDPTAGGIPDTRSGILEAWDAATSAIDELWETAAPGRFHEHDVAFGVYEGPVWSHVMYAIDNEIHHRGQGYIYLRALGLEPPGFWER
jgi:uncharacterized damage-inducible protein DinB